MSGSREAFEDWAKTKGRFKPEDFLIACDGRQANYCELRSIYEQSGGQYGWPRLDGYGECK